MAVITITRNYASGGRKVGRILAKRLDYQYVDKSLFQRIAEDLDAITLAQVCEKLGAGEILLNCIDKDGTDSGYDIELINAVKDAVTIPVIASSGAGCVEHFYEVFTETEAEAALAAGIFHRKEVSIPEVKNYLSDKVETRLLKKN